MKKIVKLLLITATMVPLIFISIRSYSATDEIDVAIIDTDLCTACGDCLEAQSMWVVDDCGYGYVYWVHQTGSFEDFLYYYNPTASHKNVIKYEIIPVCPTDSIIINW